MSTRNIPVTLPIDKDGFLRRECPYCGKPARIDAWWTKEQRQYMNQLAAAKVIGPELNKFAKDLKRLNRPGSLIRFEAKYKTPSKPLSLQEPDDMRKVVPPCHPNEPLKIREDWNKPVFCLICGESFSPH